MIGNDSSYKEICMCVLCVQSVTFLYTLGRTCKIHCDWGGSIWEISAVKHRSALTQSQPTMLDWAYMCRLAYNLVRPNSNGLANRLTDISRPL